MKKEIEAQGNKFKCDILFNILESEFICQIPYNNKNINVLFKNNHLINKDLLSIGKKLRLIYKKKIKK